MPYIFTGTPLILQSAVPINGNNSVRIRFNINPLSVVGSNNCSLLASNYQLFGPGYNSVVSVSTVGSDPQSLDLNLSSRLLAGTWNLTAWIPLQTSTGEAVVTITGDALTTPVITSFLAADVVSTAISTIINPGSTNETCESIIRQHLNPIFKGPGWDAVVAAIAQGDCPNFDNNHLAFDQLFKTSASGIYLDRITANDGITRPAGLDISDENYRKLAIKTSNGKLTNIAILDALSVFYGDDAVRAHATSSLYEPFSLSNEDSLNITVDNTNVNVVFMESEFQDISVAKAVEVAAAITRAFILNKIKAFSVAFTDTQDNKTKVKIYSGALGLKGFVRINGGKAQNSLKFESELDVYTGPVL